jgi:hypothetical protein
MALTDIAIRSAKPRAKPYKLGDTLGLFLLVQPTGGKLWRLKYRVDGREKKLGIGTYPEISLANARKRRDDARELMAGGGQHVLGYLCRVLQKAKARRGEGMGTRNCGSQRVSAVATKSGFGGHANFGD